MNNALLRSGAIVVAFWWIVLTGWSVGDLANLTFESLSLSFTKLGFVALAILLGLAYPVAYLIRRRKARLEKLSGTVHRGLSITIGPTPKGLLPPRRVIGSEFEPDDNHPLGDWLAHTKVHRPDIHAVFQALTEVYAAHIDLPAAPVKYGHGGRSLFEHTSVVVDMMLTKARTFSFDGSYSKTGTKTTTLLDPHYVFDREDAMIPLIAYAHDIGKVDVYQLDDNGHVRELRPDHDRPGRLLLARLAEVWHLPKEDREVLLNAVGYYHHPQALPRHVDDRSRALMELLLEADLAAGEWEGQNPLHKGAPVSPGVQSEGESPWKPPVKNAETTASAADTATDRGAPSPRQNVPAHSSGETAPASNAPEVPRTVELSSSLADSSLDEQEMMLIHHVIDILAMPHSINGSKRAFRIGYKYGDRVFLKEAALCKAVATALGDPKLATPAARKGDNRSHLTEDVMRSLDKLGLLVVEHDGRTYSHKTALFTVEWYDHKAFRPDPPKPMAELLLETDPATVIVEIKGQLSHLAKLTDCRLIPKIVRPLMGVHKAINKPRPAAADHVEGTVPRPVEEIVDKEPEAKVNAEGKVPPNTHEAEIYPPVFFESKDAAPLDSQGATLLTDRGEAFETDEQDGQAPVPHERTEKPVEHSSQESRAPSGMKRRANKPRDTGITGEEILDSILSLTAAAEEKAAAKARKISAKQADLGTGEPGSVESERKSAATEEATPTRQELAPPLPPPAFPAHDSAAVTTSTPNEPPAPCPPLAQSPVADPAPTVSATTGDDKSTLSASPAKEPAALLVRVQAAVQALALPVDERKNSQGVIFLTCPVTPELSSEIADVMREIALRPRQDVKVITDKRTGERHLAFEKKVS